MRALIAFDKFKDSLSVRDACDLTAAVLAKLHPEWQLDCCPITDGGEGFSEILTAAAFGVRRPIEVTGPRGVRVPAGFGIVPLNAIPAAARAQLALPAGTPLDAHIGILDMASASGLALLAPEERDPWKTTSVGTGELIAAAARDGAAAIVLGIGGSATNDLGLGALTALGLEFVSAAGDLVAHPIPERWGDIVAIRGALSPKLPPLRIACDVTNPLLGPRGCTAIFGPQKGLRSSDIATCDRAFARMAELLCKHCQQSTNLVDAPGAGAAGGIAFGLMCSAGARLLPGFPLVSAWLDLEARIAAADIIITGEGRFDDTSLGGKGPGAIVARARELGRRVQVFAGSVSASLDDATFHAISPPDLPLERALRETPQRLRAAIIAEFS